jgi:hypothetical protein
MRILPDNQHRIKTRVLRNTNNPFFDEQFTIYGVSREQVIIFWFLNFNFHFLAPNLHLAFGRAGFGPL